MRPRVLFSVLGLSIALSIGHAQTETPKPAPSDAPKPAPVRETPPDQKAYTDASRTMDPKAKIAALEKFKTDFPKSDMRQSADAAILSTLVKKYPNQKGRIMKQAKLMYANAEARSQGSVANEIATEFVDSGRFLGEAERYAKIGVADMQEARYVKELKDGVEKRKGKMPSEDEIAKRYHESRAVRVATLGRVEVARGQVARGQKLLEEAWAANPNLVVVGATLGELAYQAGDDSKALALLVPARLSGRAPEAANQALEALYKNSMAVRPTASLPCWMPSITSGTRTPSKWRSSRPRRSAATGWCWPKCSLAPDARRAWARTWHSTPPWSAMRART